MTNLLSLSTEIIKPTRKTNLGIFYYFLSSNNAEELLAFKFTNRTTFDFYDSERDRGIVSKGTGEVILEFVTLALQKGLTIYFAMRYQRNNP